MKTRQLIHVLTTATLVSAGSLRRPSSRYSDLQATAEIASPHLPLHAPPDAAPLIPQASSDVEAISKPVHLLAASGNLAEMKALLEKEPFWIMARDDHGWTPLHEACRGAHIEMIDYLVGKGADLNAMTYTGATPLYEAEKYNGRDSTVVRYLLSIGALRHEAKAQLRGSAASTKSREELVANRVPHTLAGEGRMDELNQLADMRGEWVLDAVDSNGWTPLMEVSRYGHLHIARFLVDRGVDVNALSSEGGTPLYYAKMFWGKESDIVSFLQSVGAVVSGPPAL